jgi:hypothetical protein
MSAVTHSAHLNPISQVEQVCSSVSALLSTLCEKTDSAFRRVHVMKRDGSGNIKLYDVKDKETGVTRKVGVLSYVEDIKTGEMQLDEPGYVISFKCALLVLGVPFYTIGKMAWYIFKTPFEISALAVETLIKAGEYFAIARLYEGCIEMRRGFSQIPEMFGNGLFDIIKAPIFGLAAEFASIYGIFRPYHGRKIEALIENAWQQGASYKDDFRNIPARTGENCWTAFVKDLHDAHPFYLAHCFQVRGNVNDSRIVVIGRDVL